MSRQPACTPASGDSKQPGSQVHTLTASHWTMCKSRRPPTTHYVSHPGTPCALVRLVALQSRIMLVLAEGKMRWRKRKSAVARTIVVEVHQDGVADAVQLLVHKPLVAQDEQRAAVSGPRVRVPHNTVRRVQHSKLGRRGEGGHQSQVSNMRTTGRSVGHDSAHPHHSTPSRVAYERRHRSHEIQSRTTSISPSPEKS